MAVKIRMARHGTTNKPFYRIVAADSAAKRDGRYLELLGTYDPTRNPAEVNLKQDRIDYWLSVGATPSDTVKSILKKQKAAK